MSDLIRREDAIEVVCELVPIRNDAVEIADAIRVIPSADLNSEFSEWARHWFKDSAERKGEWIDTHKVYCGSTVFACSECKSEIDEIPTYYNEPMYKWCPYCGADMRGEHDGR